MNFAALEARVNATVLEHVGNARVVLGGVDVPGVFNNPGSVANLGVGAADSSPSVSVASSAVPADAEGQLVQINSMPFGIVRAEPDGTGMTLLTVEHIE